VADQLVEDLGALPLAGVEDARHSDRRVVVEDGPRHAAEPGERLGVTEAERLSGFLGEDHHERRIAVRQVHGQEVALLLDAVDHHDRLAEVDLGMTGRMDQRHEHLAVPDLVLAHDILHHRIASGVVVFIT